MRKLGLFKVLLITFAAAVVLVATILLLKPFFGKSDKIDDSETPSNMNQIPANQGVNSSNAKPNPILTAKVERDVKLQNQADSLLKLFDNMPQVPVLLKDEPILKTGSEVERGLGYTICEEKTRPTVFIKKVFYQKGNQKQITNILKHELTHAWFCRKGVQVGHGVDFRKKFESIGGFGN